MSTKIPAEQLSIVFPITQVAIYPGGDLLIKRKSQLQGQIARGNRKQITVLSRRGLANLILTVKSNLKVKFRSMLTLTYSANFPVSGKVSKGHLHGLLCWLEKKFGHFDYFWFAEFQRRGAIHYHLVSTLPISKVKRRMFAEYWVNMTANFDWWYSRISDRKLFHVKQSALKVALHPATWQSIRLQDGAVRYALKYATKPYQKVAPPWFGNIGRFWGTNLKCEPVHIVDTNETELRHYLANKGHKAASWEYLPKIVYKTWT